MCYRFELFEFEDCLFKNVDATYILHLEGNGRLDSIYEQLKTYHPTKKVYIVYNKGYKKCSKNMYLQTVGNDIVHANITAFEHANQYKHVLVLEDDFFFSKEVKKHAAQVDTFLEKDTSFVYQLGSNPLFALPVSMYHYRVLGSLGHANIYSRLSRKKLLDDYQSDKMNYDFGALDNYTYKVVPIYMYYMPLCYQLFPMTDSRKSWFKNPDNKLAYFIEVFMNTFISWTNLEKEPEPGFTILYWIGKCMPLVLVLFLVGVIRCFPKSGLNSRRVR